MAQYYIQPTIPHLLPHSLILGSSHVVEIKKGGLHVGIYVITSSLRRRGVILPVDIWTALVSAVEGINCEIDSMRGIPIGTTSASSIFDYGFIEEGSQYNITTNNGNTTQPLTMSSQQNGGNEE